MPFLKRTATAVVLTSALGFLFLRCQSGEPVFPAPAAGYSEETVHYEKTAPETTVVVSLPDSARRVVSSLQLPDWKTLQQFEGIRLTGKITPPADCDSAVFFAEFSRRHRQTLQIVASSSAFAKTTDGKLDADLAIERPSCSGELSLTVLMLPLDVAGEPLVPQPILISQGTLTVPKPNESLTSLP